MNIYLLERAEDAPYADYDDFESFVVVCNNEQVARGIQPRGEYYTSDDEYYDNVYNGGWVCPENVKVTHIGLANEATQAIGQPVQDERINARILCTNNLGA